MSNHNSSGKSLAVVNHGVVSKLLMPSSGAGRGPILEDEVALGESYCGAQGSVATGYEQGTLDTWGQQARALTSSGASGGQWGPQEGVAGGGIY